MGQEYCADTASTGAASGRYTTSGALKEESASKVVAARVEILSRIARVFLQFGSLRDAEVYFVRAERAAGTQEDNPRVSASLYIRRIGMGRKQPHGSPSPLLPVDAFQAWLSKCLSAMVGTYMCSEQDRLFMPRRVSTIKRA